MITNVGKILPTRHCLDDGAEDDEARVAVLKAFAWSEEKGLVAKERQVVAHRPNPDSCRLEASVPVGAQARSMRQEVVNCDSTGSITGIVGEILGNR